MSGLSANSRGAIFMMLSMAGFVFNDALMKLVLVDIALFQAIFVRGIFSTLLMVILCWRLGALRLRGGFAATLLDRMVLLRTLGEVGGTFFFLTALSHMPIANVTAVLQILPLTITFAAALFLGEKVGWRRYAAITVGLVGVLIIIRPGGSDFNWFAIYAVIATSFITLRDLATRQMPDHVQSLNVSLISAIAVLLMGAIGSAFAPWQPLSNTQFALLSGAAAILMVGYLCSILAMRSGEVSFIAPFRYTILLWSLFLGYFVFGDVPDNYALIGAFLVVGSGLFSFHRERLTARKARLSPGTGESDKTG